MQKKRGFTLIELLVSFIILSIVVIIVASTYQRNTQVWLKSDQMRDVQQNARIALERMTADIKQAGYVYGNRSPLLIPPGNGPAITTADQNTITFNAVVRDVNGDGLKSDATSWAINVDTETITFSVINSRIQRHSEHATGTYDIDLTFPAVNVIDLDFEYKDSTGTNLGVTYGYPLPIGPPDRRYEVRYVEITLTVERGAGQAEAATGRERIVLRSGVSPPNLKQ